MKPFYDVTDTTLPRYKINLIITNGFSIVILIPLLLLKQEIGDSIRYFQLYSTRNHFIFYLDNECLFL